MGDIGGIKMPMTEKKRKTDYAWKKKNKANLTCTLYKADADAFRAYAAARGESVQSLLRGYVAQCLGRPLERRGPAPSPPGGDGEEEQDQ